MKLDEVLTYFNKDELLAFISSELKSYLTTSIEKKSIIQYIKMNIMDLFEKKEFVVLFLKKFLNFVI